MIKIAKLSVIHPDEIAHYIILVLTFHTPSFDPLFSSFYAKDAFVGEIKRKFDVFYEKRNITVELVPYDLFKISSLYLLK